ncbi:MAG: recombinase family protein [Planctomycetales bacterium]|nr:recombinase family protein [Planctomycetales bacterium]
MLKHHFDPHRPYRAVIYARMSSDKQNERSPDQQIAEIKRRIALAGYPWQIVKIYRDDGISGRYVRKRPAYQQMMRELKSGLVAADLILSDTAERFGRVEELDDIRRRLFQKYGILLLTANSNFADPNSSAGRALGAIEKIRATEDGRVKAHNVLRGKRDAVEQKHWPGGEAPLGFMLKSVMTMVRGREEVDHCLLIPNPESSWIMLHLFELAKKTGHGTTRLAKALNNDPLIPAKFKPFKPSTIGHWLDSHIYYGDLYWGEVCTDIIDDTRITQQNPDEEIVHVPEFCEAIVPRKLWWEVQTLRIVRRARVARMRKLAAARRQSVDTADERLLKAVAPGMTLNYLLSGFVFCECGVRMTASSSGTYTTKDGEERRYVSYVCPDYLAGNCKNDRRVPEEWLRAIVVNQLRDRLLSRIV